MWYAWLWQKLNMQQGDAVASLNLYLCRYVVALNGLCSMYPKHTYNAYNNLVVINIEYDMCMFLCIFLKKWLDEYILIIGKR